MDRLTKLLADVFELSPSEISMDHTPDDIEIWDSLLQLTLISNLEEEFDIEIPDDDAEKIATVQAAIDYVTANS